MRSNSTWKLLAALACILWSSNSADAVLRFDDGGEHTVGGGPSDRIVADDDTTVNVLDGSITLGNDAAKLPDGSFIGGGSGLMALNQGRMIVAGGSFTGGNSEPIPGTSVTLRPGDGARLIEGSMEIQNGQFNGGAGFRFDGSGMDLFRSSAVVYDGTFMGLTAVSAHHGSTLTIYGGDFIGDDASLSLLVGDYEIHGGHFSVTDPQQEVVVSAGSEFELDIFGGQFDGAMRIDHGALTFHGQNLSVSEQSPGVLLVTGMYESGEPFSQEVRFDATRPGVMISAEPTEVAILTGLPEPHTAALASVAVLAGVCRQRRRLGTARRRC